MLSFLKGTGAIIGTIGVGLTINYHLSSPLFDVEQYQQQKWGKKVLPLPFPDDMETRWPVRLINSVGDTYLRVTGKNLFHFDTKTNRKKLGELEKLLKKEEFERFHEAFERGVRIYHPKWGASPIEIFITSVLFKDLMNARLKIEKTFLEPESQKILKEEKLKPHIMITGQPRTGSTFLHHLLAMDPNCRYLTEWEQVDPLPFPTKEKYSTDPRAEQFKKRQKTMEFFVKNIVKHFRSYHDHDGSGIEEEYFLLGHCMMLPLPMSSHNVPSDNFDWYVSFPRLDEYKYIKNFLILNQHYNPPKSHFVFKAPFHSAYFESFTKVFDEAVVIVTHRDPLSTIPSLSKLMMFVLASLSRDIKTDVWFCREEHGKSITHIVKILVEKMSEARKKNPELNERILDVEYADLVKDPMGVVRSIYDFAKIPLSPEAEQKMMEHLEKDKKERAENKKGSKFNPYSLQEFCLEGEKIKEVFAEYRKERGYPE